MIKIINVRDPSNARKAGIRQGDFLVRINGAPVVDFLDYMATSGSSRELEFAKSAGEILNIHDEGESDFGIVLDGFKEKKCGNKCVFCFVDQLPGGLRPSLYVKDEDYRLSFLHGNYITLTNMSKVSIERIDKLHLSPLYISVHTTNPVLRGTMLGLKRPAPILDQLKYLISKGIEIHCQIVLCGGLNDKHELDNTLNDLECLFPEVASISITPVGLSEHRGKLVPLKKPAVKEVRRILKMIHLKAENYKRTLHRSMIYPTDEMYVLGQCVLPSYSYYDDFCQIENGAGIICQFERDFLVWKREYKKKNRFKGRKELWVCGEMAYPYLRKTAATISRMTGKKIEVLSVQNRFLGKSITVSGLLSGQDIMDALKPYALRVDRIVLPSICFNQDGIMLDGFCLNDFKKTYRECSIHCFENFKRLAAY